MSVDGTQPPKLPFTVVGIGASAGGLEAFTEFFGTMPPDKGMAYVLVQHLSPKRESMIAEILQRHTAMPVLQVEDRMPVEPNHVYVIRPGHTMTIKDGRLHLGESLLKPGHSRPVDDFFRSLAEEQRERAVGIILSGMGSNGTAGAQAIKVVGGCCIAQEPDSAKFPSMPRSLIDANLADFILKPQEMPDVLLRYAQHHYVRGERSAELIARRESQQVSEILAILRARVRNDFTGYKKPTLVRRIQRRMSLTQHSSMADYARMLRQTPGEVVNLSDDLMIHVTGFFRDADVWEALREKVILPMVAEKQDQSSIRVWVTACASGEEAYTLAMLLVEAAEQVDKRFDVKVFATDMADRALVHARAGIFPGGIESEISPERLVRFFDKDDSMYRVKKELRELVVFAPQNVLQDPPFSRLDIITCRNLMIYLEVDIQQRVLALLHFGLREGGTLVLGNSETIGDRDDLFQAIDKKLRIYRRLGPTRHGLVDFPLPHRVQRQPIDLNEPGEPRLMSRASLAQVTNKVLLETYTPPAIVVDRQGRIVYFHGETELFLEQPRGEPTCEVLVLARDFVRGSVRVALHQAIETGAMAVVKDGTMRVGETTFRVEVTAAPLDRRGMLGYYLVSFIRYPVNPATTLSENGHEHGDLADKLRGVRDELQSTIEELQTANEELKASNEEATSINEELQSTNEELETSKEELQSLNEELATVNAQLEAKMEEVERTGNDLASLLSSTDIAVIFLDTQFRIRRFTPAVKKLMELIPSDIGRPLSDLALKFTDPTLPADAAGVLDTLVPVEKEVDTPAGQWYTRRVLPYRTSDNRIEGVVVTFVDITARRAAETTARNGLAELNAVIDLVPDLLWQSEPDGRTPWYNRAWLEYTGQSPQQAGGSGWLAAIHPDDREQLAKTWRTGEAAAIRQEQRVRRHDGVYHWFLLQAKPLVSDVGGVFRWFAAATDIHEQRTHLEELRGRENQLRTLLENARDFAILMMDEHSIIRQWSAGATALLGWTEDEAIGQPAAMIFTDEDRRAGAPEHEAQLALRDGRAPDERWHRRKDGSQFWGSGVMSAIRDDSGRHLGFVKVLRDVTDRRQTDAERAQLLEAEQHARAVAESANAAKDQFLANISHELRTPLSAILLWSRVLRDNCSDPDTLAEGLAAVEQSARAQQKLIDDLLDSARIATGKLSLELKPTDLARTVGDAVNTIRPAAEAKGVEMQTEFAANIGQVLADADRLQQVIWNLVNNAVKFTPAGGRVDVGLWRRDQTVEIRVTDTGVGIAADDLPSLFERFRQVDPSSTRRHGGLGLGLTISRQLIELHGGTITAASDGPGRGCVFTILLPLPRRTARAKTLPPKTADLAGVRVLLVEDDERTRDVMVMLLRQAGATVEAFPHADPAIAAFLADPPDLLLSDIGLPDKDGYTMLRELRAAEAPGSRVPALAFTAFDRPQDRTLAIESGFDEFLSKPVDPVRMLQVLRTLLGR